MESKLPPSLRHLVSWSVSILGKAIISEYGEDIYYKIDKVRLQMKKMRRLSSKNWKKSLSILLQEYEFLDKLSPTTGTTLNGKFDRTAPRRASTGETGRRGPGFSQSAPAPAGDGQG
jgi:hypothetical protein